MSGLSIRQVFPDPLWVEPIFGGKWRDRIVLKDFRYCPGGGQPDIVVPAGFITDFASIPWFLRSIIAPWGRHGPAAVLHDYLYATVGGKIYADWIFLQALTRSGCWLPKRWGMFLAVLAFGWFAYWKHKRFKAKGKNND